MHSDLWQGQGGVARRAPFFNFGMVLRSSGIHWLIMCHSVAVRSGNESDAGEHPANPSDGSHRSTHSPSYGPGVIPSSTRTTAAGVGPVSAVSVQLTSTS